MAACRISHEIREMARQRLSGLKSIFHFAAADLDLDVKADSERVLSKINYSTFRGLLPSVKGMEVRRKGWSVQVSS